jgi:hypothetical protein
LTVGCFGFETFRSSLCFYIFCVLHRFIISKLLNIFSYKIEKTNGCKNTQKNGPPEENIVLENSVEGLGLNITSMKSFEMVIINGYVS